MNDHQSFKEHAELCAEYLCNKNNPALSSKYENLVQESKREVIELEPVLNSNDDLSKLSEQQVGQVVSDKLLSCKGIKERDQKILDILIKNTGTLGGYLYTMRKDGPLLAAQSGYLPPPPELDSMAISFIASEIDETEDITITSIGMNTTSAFTTDWTMQGGETYHPLLLGHHSDEGFQITGLAVLLLSADKGFEYPTSIVFAISKYLHDSGDVCSSVATS